MLGLFAFFYACLHFLTYLVLDQCFDWQTITQDIVKRPYITVGFAAFVLLIPLAITSNARMLRWLGGRRWKRLHQTVYIIAIAGVAHFCWLVKKDLSVPLRFALILSVVLGLRVYFWLRQRQLARR
jgi:sulfoxide reductase heme-binding subunit YedZ